MKRIVLIILTLAVGLQAKELDWQEQLREELQSNVGNAKKEFIKAVNITPEGWDRAEKEAKPAYDAKLKGYNQAICDSGQSLSPELVERAKDLAQRVGVDAVEILPSPDLPVKSAGETLYVKEDDFRFPKNPDYLNWVLVRNLMAIKFGYPYQQSFASHIWSQYPQYIPFVPDMDEKAAAEKYMEDNNLSRCDIHKVTGPDGTPYLRLRPGPPDVLNTWMKQQQKQLDTEATLFNLCFARAALNVLEKHCDEPCEGKRSPIQPSPCERYAYLRQVYDRMAAEQA